MHVCCGVLVSVIFVCFVVLSCVGCFLPRCRAVVNGLVSLLGAVMSSVTTVCLVTPLLACYWVFFVHNACRSACAPRFHCLSPVVSSRVHKSDFGFRRNCAQLLFWSSLLFVFFLLVPCLAMCLDLCGFVCIAVICDCFVVFSCIDSFSLCCSCLAGWVTFMLFSVIDDCFAIPRVFAALEPRVALLMSAWFCRLFVICVSSVVLSFVGCIRPFCRFLALDLVYVFFVVVFGILSCIGCFSPRCHGSNSRH